MLLAIAGHFPGAGYVDARGPPAAGDADIDANLGRLPTLVTREGVAIGQSAAINHYVAGVTGLLGDGPLEAAQIIAFHEHLAELNQQFRKLVPYGVEPDAAKLDTFFGASGATDFAGPADGATRDSRNLLWYMGRLERLVGDGFVVGGKLTLADVEVFRAFGDALTPEQAAPGLPAWRREPFSDASRTRAALAAHPRLQKIVDNVGAHPNIKKWIEVRGPQGF